MTTTPPFSVGDRVRVTESETFEGIVQKGWGGTLFVYRPNSTPLYLNTNRVTSVEKVEG